MKIKAAAAFLTLLLLVCMAATAQGQKVKALTPEAQKAFLATRLPSGGVVGTFDSYCSLLFALHQVAIHTESSEINATTLHSPFPGFYKPTWKELFDTIALQTKSSWQYDPTRDYWVFSAPALQKPYAIAMADKWTTRDMGIWTGYAPAKYPAGMDIYYYGVYSADNPEDGPALWEKVRNTWALTFASKLKPQITAAEMKKVTIDGAEALYFEAPAPRNNLLWRQWAFVKDGKMFLILSTIPADDKATMAEVDAMVSSFKVAQ